MKKSYTPKQKASIALAAIKGEPVSKLASLHQIHPAQIGQWKKVLETEAEKMFSDKRKKENYGKEKTIEELYKIIGQREVEISWLKKNSTLNSREKLSLIEKDNPEINLTRQAELLDISRSSIYYAPIIDPREIQIKNTIDEIYAACPFYGSRKIKKELEINRQIKISRGYVQNLMREMGLQAIYPRKKLNLSQGDKQHKKYPYLLRNLEIVRINQVWSTDITYARLKNSFAYLTVIFDWHSRYVISWKLSATLENDFCIQALKEALEIAKPEIHNSDQGVQYTAENYVAVLEEAGIQISMDGRGRCTDNIFTERLWRTVKYENIYLYDCQNIEEARIGLTEYFQFCNHRRIHQSLDYQTPAQIYLPDNQLIFKNQIHLIEANILS